MDTDDTSAHSSHAPHDHMEHAQRRERRREELRPLTHQQLIERLIEAEEAVAAAAAAAAATAAVAAATAVGADPSVSSPSSSSSLVGRKHAHSPRPLEGEPPAKQQTRGERRKERRGAEMAKAEAGAHGDSGSKTTAMTEARDADAAANEEATAATSSAEAAAGETDGVASTTSGDGAAASGVASVAAGAGKAPRARKKQDEFDWTRVHRRQIALKLMYIGTEYAGFAIQPQIRTERTVEGELIRALLLTKLAPERDAARLTRCGRTDKGVHSSGQVVSVQVRSRLTRESELGMLARGHQWREEKERAHTKKREFMDNIQPAAGDTSLFDKQGFLAPAPVRDSMCLRCGLPGVGFASDADCSTHEQELDYCRMLNGVLPPTIRIVSWQPVSPAFNARFSCTARTYRYFFHADDLSLSRMQSAASSLVGSHDFRNFCKIDPSMSTHFTRCLTNIEVRVCERVPEDCVQIAAPWPCTQEQWFEDARNNGGGNTEEQMEAQRNNSVAASSAPAASASSPSPSSSPPPFPPSSSPPLHPDTLCELLIHGNAFLYHQVRCMAAILLLVGRGVETVDLVPRMLDVDATPNKPNYDMAPESPLVLYDTFFPSLPLTPGFDYQTRPATRPDDKFSFVGIAAQQQSEMMERLDKEREQQRAHQQAMADDTDSVTVDHATTSVEANSAAASPSVASSAAAASAPSAASSLVGAPAALASSPPAAAAAPSASVASSSPSSSASASPSSAAPSGAGAASSASAPLNLYPSAALCLRNEEIVFSHFHRLWRSLSMDAKVHELFVNQCARNLQAVRNECAKMDMQRLQQATGAGAHVHSTKRPRHPPRVLADPCAGVRTCAPLLAATAGCRGHGLRGMPLTSHSSHVSILRRPTEKSYDDKVAQLKGKKLARHQSVKEMSDKFKKKSHMPIMHKMEQ